MENYLIEARRICRKYNYVKKIAVEINGKLLYLTEGEVRALQLLARQKADESDEAFEQFCKDVVVYSNFQKRKSKYTMKFQKDGCFANEFECGFFNANAHMACELLGFAMNDL